MSWLKKKSWTEEEIVHGCKSKSAKAQRAFYDKYASKMLSIAVRYLSDRDLAEDIVLQSFMRVFDHIDRFEMKGSFEGWVKKIVVNQALMQLRKDKQVTFVDMDSAPQIADQQALAIDQISCQELFELIEQLPLGYRTVFNLYAIEGLLHAEIAEQLQISVGASKSQLHKAKLALQKMIANKQYLPTSQIA